MKRPENLNTLRLRIKAAPSGSAFVASDFADITDNAKLGVGLSRLEEEGIIVRIIRGVYYKPEFSKLLGEIIAPSPDTVAHAIARNFGWTIIPCGDTALNLLGLSTQVPSVWSYVSDGAYKEYVLGNTTLKFKRTTNKEISKLSEKTALIIQALKALGKDQINDEVIYKLKARTTAAERKAMLKEAQYATSWIYEVIKQICR